MKEYCRKQIVENNSRSSKVKETLTEPFEQKEYLHTKIVQQARVMFSSQSHMFPCKMNFIGEPKFKIDLWRCDSCQTNIDSQSHVMVCEAYKSLREGKDINNNNDIAEYLTKVVLIREKMGFLK